MFARLFDHGLIVNQDNCNFGVTSIPFWGIKVFSPLPAKVSAVNKRLTECNMWHKIFTLLLPYLSPLNTLTSIEFYQGNQA